MPNNCPSKQVKTTVREKRDKRVVRKAKLTGEPAQMKSQNEEQESNTHRKLTT